MNKTGSIAYFYFLLVFEQNLFTIGKKDNAL